MAARAKSGTPKPAKNTAARKNPEISDAAVFAATGHFPDHWYALLDRWNGPDKGHAAMARWLRHEQGLSAWYSQMVTVMYERARGLRKVRERPEGFAVSVTRRVRTSARHAWLAMVDADHQGRWFTTRAVIDLRVGGQYSNRDGDRGEFQAVKPPRLLRFTWNNARHAAGSVVQFEIRPLEAGKVQLALTHSRLSREKDAADLKEGWNRAMDSLKSYLETGRGLPHEEWLAGSASAAGRTAAHPGKAMAPRKAAAPGKGAAAGKPGRSRKGAAGESTRSRKSAAGKKSRAAPAR